MTHELTHFQIGPDLRAAFLPTQSPDTDNLQVLLLADDGREIGALSWDTARPTDSGAPLQLGHLREGLFLEGYQRYLLELAGWRHLGQFGIYPTEWREPVRSIPSSR